MSARYVLLSALKTLMNRKGMTWDLDWCIRDSHHGPRLQHEGHKMKPVDCAEDSHEQVGRDLGF
eukprot:353894-Pelagomonas_calceolata.AAC.1